jgi:hypothetical protein
MIADESDVKKYMAKGGQVTLAGLARLRSDMKISKNHYYMAQANVVTTQMRAYALEDLIQSKQSGAGTIHWSIENRDSSWLEYSSNTSTKLPNTNTMENSAW